MSHTTTPADDRRSLDSNDANNAPGYDCREPTWEECTPIVRGQVVPHHDRYIAQNGPSRIQRAIRLSLLHAVRTYLPYAQRAEVIALCQHDAAVARMRNARLIMSNVIPEIESNDHFPYCIWYPDLATEDTYRKVATRYPKLKYHVGRACAVAGYVDLYRQLDLLPEISIAEEARESGNGAQIFSDIMEKPQRYKVMDDYTRTVRQEAAAGAGLNGDTAVVAYMRNHRLSPQRAIGWDHTLLWDETQRGVGFEVYTYFNITEDGRIAPPEEVVDHDVADSGSDVENEEQGGDDKREDARASNSCSNSAYGPKEAWLLYSPLPRDLPSVNKDLLILRAAWEGNVDRYARLRRPFRLLLESSCIVRGIYHSTAFAKWWYAQPDCDVDFLQAARSRFVMMNDISWLWYKHPRDDEEEANGRWLPQYMIWWPEQPEEETLAELVKRDHRMRVQVAHAAIFCNYLKLYKDVDISPNDILLKEAKQSTNPEYLQHLQRKASDPAQYCPPREASHTTSSRKESPSQLVFGSVDADRLWGGYGRGPYLGLGINFADVDLFMASPLQLLEAVHRDELGSHGVFLPDFFDESSESMG